MGSSDHDSRRVPTVFTHALTGFVLGRILAPERRTAAFGLLCAASAALPDADALFHGLFDVPALDLFEHRGFTHSLTFAAAWGALVAFLAWRRHPAITASAATRLGLVIFAVTASHGLLDAMTDGGTPIHLLAPFSDEGYFAPWRPIPVAPISARSFLGPWGVRVITAEVVRVWLPFLATLVVAEVVRRRRARAS
jgi:inner membrane protein